MVKFVKQPYDQRAFLTGKDDTLNLHPKNWSETTSSTVTQWLQTPADQKELPLATF